MRKVCANPKAIPHAETFTKGWVLFDDDCGICRRLVPFWQKTFTRLNLKTIPLQTPWVKEALQISDSELLVDFRLLLQNGLVIENADVYRYVLKHVWWGKPLYPFTKVPGLAWFFDRAYLSFANNRYKIAKVCGLQKPLN